MYKKTRDLSPCSVGAGHASPLRNNRFNPFFYLIADLIQTLKIDFEFKTEEDLGKTVFEGFITLRPLGSAQLSVKYKLPFKKGTFDLVVCSETIEHVVDPKKMLEENGN